MNIGQLIKLPDGRIATYCYNNLDGRGAKLGDHRAQIQKAVERAHSEGTFFNDDFPEPDIMLRAPYPDPSMPNVEYVGEEFELVEE